MPKVKVPNPPIVQEGAQDGLPQPSQRAAARIKGLMSASTNVIKGQWTPRRELGAFSKVGTLPPDPERDAIADLLASQGITNPTMEDYEAARAQVAHEASLVQPPLPAAGGDLPLRTRQILEEASGKGGYGPSKAQLGALGDASTTPQGAQDQPVVPFNYTVDVPSTPDQAKQILNYLPPEFKGIHAALDLNGKPIAGEWVDAKGEHLDPTLEQQYENFLVKQDIALDIWNDYLDDLRAQASGLDDDKRALALYKAQLQAKGAVDLDADTEKRLRDKVAADEQAARDLDTYQKQADFKAKLDADAAILQRDFDATQAQLDRDIQQGNLDATVEHNRAMEDLDKKRFALEQTQQAFLMIASIAANPAILFFMRQSGLLQTLTDQFGLDFSMFDYGGGAQTLPFTLSDLARMSPSERKLAIGKVSAATGKSEADIMDELRRGAPGSGATRPQRTTL